MGTWDCTAGVAKRAGDALHIKVRGLKIILHCRVAMIRVGVEVVPGRGWSDASVHVAAAEKTERLQISDLTNERRGGRDETSQRP